ncbi:hypothetical protein PVK06_019848 [Gossypium arboreum]|uniref:Uncharacterized protein n=1 Tax=Gossypium arboreum TaxID=29729 RepID=A0ABR0PKT8_GOSAR|nr:hypothetical protein PVK06_019848 [Gossypium arboreum]
MDSMEGSKENQCSFVSHTRFRSPGSLLTELIGDSNQVTSFSGLRNSDTTTSVPSANSHLIPLSDWFDRCRGFFHLESRRFTSSSPCCHRMCRFICSPSFLTIVSESPSIMASSNPKSSAKVTP